MKNLAEIRNDVVGSLLRPISLKEARMRYDEGKMTLAQFRQVEDQAIVQAIRMQEEIGLAVLTDGEYRRLNFQDSFGESVSGYDAAKATLKFYEQRVEGSNPLQRWEIPDHGDPDRAGPNLSEIRLAEFQKRLSDNGCLHGGCRCNSTRDHSRAVGSRLPLRSNRRAGVYRLRRSTVAASYARSGRRPPGEFSPLIKSR